MGDHTVAVDHDDPLRQASLPPWWDAITPAALSWRQLPFAHQAVSSGANPKQRDQGQWAMARLACRTPANPLGIGAVRTGRPDLTARLSYPDAQKSPNVPTETRRLAPPALTRVLCRARRYRRDSRTGWTLGQHTTPRTTYSSTNLVPSFISMDRSAQELVHRRGPDIPEPFP